MGTGKLIDPARVARVVCSPRSRARRTLALLLGEEEGTKEKEEKEEKDGDGVSKIVYTEDIREWDYGVYEGLLPSEIAQVRRGNGKAWKWDIWTEGAEGGE